MFQTLADAFATAQQTLFETLIVPVAFAIGAGNLLEDGYVAAGWLLVGLLQIAVMLLLIGPAQRLWPAEAQTDRRAVRVDVIYTLIHRLGLFKLVMFFTFHEWLIRGLGVLRAHGMPTFHIDHLWPGVTDQALVSFFIYLLVFDLANYLLHRAQHQWDWWWRLHAVHHSQRQMTMWTDNRNHLLDSVITDLALVLLAVLIGVGPAQFVALVAITQLMENLQHANLRWAFGGWGECLLISPRFHRHHHAVGIGHEEGGHVTHLKGCNFGVLFPWWDMLFRSADFRGNYGPTGIRDQIEQGRDYGQGFWAQQWLGLKRLIHADA